MQDSDIAQAWLKRLVGDWSYELVTTDTSDHPGATVTGNETIKAVGDAWVCIENSGRGSDGSASHSVTMLGFNPNTGRFSGAVAGTAAPVLFVYEGVLGIDLTSLILETEGPAMTEGRSMDRYRDVLSTQDGNSRKTSAQVLDSHGEWREFMVTRYTRKA
ncbi:DUF1579 family protein [Phenylobacterium sp. 20VBR1]|nr:DUF1579 family protein [Phenylobacterium glaciei]MBR7620917.1 DUF1579 family protein [Phenylobacterium glaciei]